MNRFGISEISVVPIRKEPSEQSEMISQLLFGETFKIVENTEKWSLIQSSFDKYEGWISNSSISYLTEELFNQLNSAPEIITQNLTNVIFSSQNEQIVIPAGATLPNYDSASKSFIINKNRYVLPEDYNTEIKGFDELSVQFLNCPYLWGGKNPFGIDCSGFVQIIYKMKGVKIPRDSFDQVNEGLAINFISDAKLGDLAFFDDTEGNIVHVGMIINSNEIIHASGKVRIDKLDQQGIYNRQLKKYTHKLRVIKRII